MWTEWLEYFSCAMETYAAHLRAQYIFTDLAEKAGALSCFEIDSAATSVEEMGNPVHPPARRIIA